MTAKPKHDIRFIVRTEVKTFPDVVTVRLVPVDLTSDGIRSPLFSWSGSDDAAWDSLDALYITAQNSRDDNEGPRWYGYDTEYREPYSVNLDRAETMVKVMRKVKRAQDKAAERYGYPQDFATYAGRTVEALGAMLGSDTFGIPVTPEHDYNGTGYRWTGVDGLRYHLDKVAQEASLVPQDSDA